MTLEGTGAHGPDPRFIAEDGWTEAFLAEVELGVPIHAASELHGVSRFTLYGWMKRGGHWRYCDTEDEAYEPYKTLVERTLGAEATAYANLVKSVHAKGQTDGRIGVMWAKIRYPEDFGNKDEPTVIVHEKEVGPRIDFEDILRWNKIVKEEGADE